MKMNFHNNNECYLLFGKELNKIIAMLQILKDNNPNVEQLPAFIDQLINMRSYDDMLDEFIDQWEFFMKRELKKQMAQAMTENKKRLKVRIK